jgi:type IV pilus assembly protein PilA
MERQQRRAQAGFTLPELLIVVAIIGLLTALVMPSIRGYQIRAKVTEAMLMLNSCRNQISETYASGAELPYDNSYGCEAVQPSRFVQEVGTTSDGVIKLQLGNQIGDLRLSLAYITLAPLNGSGQRMTDLDLGTAIRRWRCGSTLDGTDLNPEYLPSSCRG